jgi:hypothetical protein
MGITTTSKVVTRAEYHGRRAVTQPGNREWVTAIECIGNSVSLLPYIIFKAKVFQEQWFKLIPNGWRVNVSDDGWATDEISLDWLQKTFIPETKCRRQGQWILLILDGHGSHLTP